MPDHENCWEFKKCGREPDGDNVDQLGICPAATDSSCNGINGGKNGGRICWAVAGTFCDGSVQGTYAQKRLTCLSCDFFRIVENDQGLSNFTLVKPHEKIYSFS
jgi:hypothetical protein